MKRIWYLGVVPKLRHREYGFNIEDEDKRLRQVVLTIDNLVFLNHQLNFQEAPDLCYQKLKTELVSEDQANPIGPRVPVTPSDLNTYRDSHQTARARGK